MSNVVKSSRLAPEPETKKPVPSELSEVVTWATSVEVCESSSLLV